ncbi:GntR family transcriptional regulator [Marinomonas ushuaiensis DSM 15871]|uniref:GntR family transcriptional regulator n=1 Tax=Marinomonas ushuaiensis DSM 15871 TaxID=1122207 RepID=X7E4V4_9GAMM|nr:GntR family transcriptional regulator [Marinomonas ushuaiensis]ETX10211.1 GntR family transcriptional regulator [Marinomonas ushuaiensis DSM 15871]
MAETLKDQLYEALKSSIHTGTFEPGLVLLESRIARLFLTSRSPVRETLQQLCNEGIICRFDGRGYLVGQKPGKIIRREISSKEIKKDGDTSINREKSWLDLVRQVEKDTVLCSMSGRWEVNELKLAKCLKVSRAVTQHILVSLQYIGVVEHEKYSGWHVVPLNDQRLNALYEARMLLEPFMVERATKLIPTETLERFINELDNVSRDYPNIKPDRLDALEQDLHNETLRYGGNNEILTMLGRTIPILLISKHLLGGHVQLPTNDPFLQEHRIIFELMLEQKGKEAGQALRQHLADSKNKVLERLEEYRLKGLNHSAEYLRWISYN